MDKKHILIVDDCEDIRVLLSLKLTELGYFVTEAIDGYQALDLLQDNNKHRIDLVLVDIMLPHISGTNLIYKIKENGESKDIKIICITANEDRLLHNQLTKLGAYDVVTKPIKTHELNSKIEEALLDCA